MNLCDSLVPLMTHRGPPISHSLLVRSDPKCKPHVLKWPSILQLKLTQHNRKVLISLIAPQGNPLHNKGHHNNSLHRKKLKHNNLHSNALA